MESADRYAATAEAAARLVIRQYSTSFGMASRMLGAGVRQPVQNIYALVRVADEIVDGAAEQSGTAPAAARRMLDELEADTERAMAEGYSPNLVVHAFARTARQVGIGTELTRPFFASMRADLTRTTHTKKSFAEYVYGSAEVVGLMCLAVFLADEPRDRTPDELATLGAGARALGSAFQKVNFLRDLAADVDGLGRSYFPGIDPTALTEKQKNRLLDDIEAELRTAEECLPLLPPSSRRGVALAHALFAELARRLRRTPAAEVMRTRVRVPDPVKVRLALSVGRSPRRRSVGALA
ncbi:MAG: squalene/phytoene synthase family protein [Actinomycetales bacterium]|nr:squalene/phytoene synthase family protein [Actinomycetales bacterium]